MKIIEKNNRVKCNCGCVMEYENSDIHKRETSTMRCQLLFIKRLLRIEIYRMSTMWKRDYHIKKL